MYFYNMLLFLFIGPIFMIFTIWKLMQLKNKIIMSLIFKTYKSTIDFNKFIKYKNGKIYLNGKKNVNFTHITLAIQRRINEEKEKKHLHINDITDII